MTDSQSVPEQQLQNAKLMDLANFAKLLKKTELLDKRGLKPREKSRELPAPQPDPLLN